MNKQMRDFIFFSKTNKGKASLGPEQGQSCLPPAPPLLVGSFHPGTSLHSLPPTSSGPPESGPPPAWPLPVTWGGNGYPAPSPSTICPLQPWLATLMVFGDRAVGEVMQVKRGHQEGAVTPRPGVLPEQEVAKGSLSPSVRAEEKLWVSTGEGRAAHEPDRGLSRNQPCWCLSRGCAISEPRCFGYGFPP